MKYGFRAHFLIIGVILACGSSGFESTAKAAFIDDPTNFWRPVVYSTANQLDYLNDQQTGQSEGDLVGNSTHPVFYIRFDDGGTPSLTDGTIGFRARVGADSASAGFGGNLFVGIDANNNGSLDLFVAVDNSGSPDRLGIFNPGPGANTGPSTTTITGPVQTYTETSTNYNFSPVNSTIDPTVTDTDLFDDGVDYFVSFSIPFADIVSRLTTLVPGFNQNSAISYVLATATQANSLNQDINGTQGNVNSTLTFSSLGVVSNQSAPIESMSVPAPSSQTLMVLGLAGVIVGVSRRRGKAAVSTKA